MNMHVVTVGQPKLAYAKLGWEEYWRRLRHFHRIRVTHIADKHNDTAHLLDAAGKAYMVAMVIDGQELSSQTLSQFLETRALDGREVCFIIGGPEGLPAEVREHADLQWSLSKLTFPHDLAMVILLEALYRASTINAGQPYHK